MQRGDVVNVNLPPQGGHEQFGYRPAIAIVSRQMLSDAQLLLVIPLTSETKRLSLPHTFRIDPSRQNGLTVPSVALVLQLRVVDAQKVDPAPRGRLESRYLQQLDEELRKMLGL